MPPAPRVLSAELQPPIHSGRAKRFA